MSDAMNEMEVLRMLQKRCDAAGGLKAWAAANGVSPGYVSDVLNTRRGLGPVILGVLGLQKVTRYVLAQPRTSAARATYPSTKQGSSNA